MATRVTLPFLLALGLASCMTHEPDGAEPLGNGKETDQGTKSTADKQSPALVAIEGCDALEQALRQRMLDEMHGLIANNRSKYRARKCFEYEKRDAGRTAYAPSQPSSNGGASKPSLPSPVQSGSTPSAAPTEVSQTNTQIADVDEADIVETDGKYMYVVARGQLHVLQAWPASEARLIARVPVTPGTPLKLFLEGGRVVLYSSDRSTTRPACTYGYDCDFTGDGSRTRVTVFDVSNPAQPTTVRQFFLSGSLIAARRIGNAVHTVVADMAAVLPGVYTPHTRCEATEAEVDEGFTKLELDNEAAIRALDLTTLVPRITDDRSADPAASLLGQCAGFYAASRQDSSAFTTLLSFDLTSDQPATTSTIISRSGAVFMSADSMYIAVRQNTGPSYARWVPSPAEDFSIVHRFEVGAEPSKTRYAASGEVPGHALNQFAMDEHEGALRIATSSGHVPHPNVSSNLSVLQQEGTALQLVGQLRGIAPSEDIRSVRFAGERGYVVTFKKTDPLYVFDLSDARKPRIAGELKIPGFSTYMQALDDDHLLTIGYDADDQGSFAYFSGVLLQIFDVSNPKDPKLAHKVVIGTRGSSSEALTDHLAFNYFAPKKLLAIPMTICEGGSAGSNGTTMTFSGLMLYDVDVATGMKERGRVAHPQLAGGLYDSASCSNWWTNASSTVQRSVFMDDFVYSVANDVVRIQNLSALGADVRTVTLPAVGAIAPQP